MSGPFGVNMTVISAQKFSMEMAVAASTFLSMGFLTITPVSGDGRLRREFMAALETFCDQKQIDYYSGPRYYAVRVLKPSRAISTADLFWLALDQEGESLAKLIFEANGEPTDKNVYRSIRKLNLLEQTIPPPPHIPEPAPVQRTFWQRLGSLASVRPGSKPARPTRHSTTPPPITVEPALYESWFEALYEALRPWQNTIKNIQSDYS